MAYTPFVIRTKKPVEEDELIKCYIRQKDGYNGWSGAVLGNPTDDDANVLSNCVGYAQGRFCELYDIITGYRGTNKYFYLNCSAGAFLERVKKTYPDLETSGPDGDPRPGAIMVWAGHVAVVEKVVDKNTVYTSESSYGGKAFFNVNRGRSNNWSYNKEFLGFIYNPAIDEVEVVEGDDEHNPEVNQVKALNSSLRVRTLPSTQSDKVGHVTKDKYYTYFATEENEDYTWYQIDTYNWIADTGSIEVLKKEEEQEPEIIKYSLLDLIKDILEAISIVMENIFGGKHE